ncbi:MAG: PaaI family thioesterase [Myxococcota bacterium]
MLAMGIEDIERFVQEHFPQAVGFGRIEALDGDVLRMRLAVEPQHLRPGGTVSGPTLMTLADTAIYYLVLSRIGPVPLAVTTDLHMHFLRRPRPEADLLATAELLKLGRRLAVARVTVRSDGADAPVAHATGTYAIPPQGASST